MTKSRASARIPGLASSFQSFLVGILLYGFAKVNPSAADSNERKPFRAIRLVGALCSSITSYVSSDQMARDVIHVAINLMLALLH
jgi:hypothetical protein